MALTTGGHHMKAQTKSYRDALQYLVDILDPGTEGGQRVLYSNTLSPVCDDETIVDYLKDVLR